ncbi:MAG TPA: class I SAM-dependent methyltransferase [Trebonia sp.]|nr:class I SAM-dependent methyltransferase [Trebonia sp.]
MDDRDEKLRRGSSFGAVAAAYSEHRPNYPDEAIRWCLAPAATSAAVDISALKVLDLGAGTGKLTLQLTGIVGGVTAVEPDQAMLAELTRLVPSVPAFLGSAESIPLPDASVHAVVCGQSLHWFNLDLALPEIARVLVPGGVLGAMWNSDDDRVDWVAGLQAAAEGAASPSLSNRRPEAAGFAVAVGGDGGERYFTPSVNAEFPNAQRRTADSMVATIATHSRFLIMEPERRDRVLAQVRDYLSARPETSAGEFTLPMVTSVIRAIKRP